MAVKTPGDDYLHKTRKKMKLLLVLVIFGAIVFSTIPAEAAGTPAKVIAFTDKKVYTAWWMSAKTTTPTFNKLDDEGQTILLYAFVLDDDGNIMKGRTVQVTLNDTDFDHFEKADWTIHTTMVGNNTYFTNTKNLNDTGTFGDVASNDGLYTTTITIPSNLLTDVQTSPRMDDQIRVKIDVKDTASGLNTTTYVLISYGKCHQAATTSHPAHVTTTASDLCTNCHGGYEHFFENVSKTIPDEYLDVHFQKLGDSLPDSTEVVKGMQAYNWNSTQLDGLAPYGTNASWKLRSGGGAVFCRFCHKDPAASNWFDYGSGDRANMADKPSCGQGTSGYSGNCHSTTDIEGAPVLNWTQNAAISNTNDTLAGINKQKAHNHSTRSANVTCTLCHNGPHGLSRPNPTTTNVTLICQTCHNRSDGWINNTRYNENISHPVGSACKNCHVNNNILDTHLVPIGVFGGRWCMDCHKINGKAPIFIDEAVANVSNPNYIHYRLNNNSDATNASRICWACHTNDSVVQNNIVNSTQIPLSSHPANYNTPRKCLDCHNKSTGINFSAPQPQRHTWWAPTMKTPAVTYCTNCHAQSESVLSFNQSATAPKNDNESTSHYGKNRTDFKSWVGQKTYCAYCHQNESVVYGPFAKESNKVRSDHASRLETPSCANNTCHRTGRLHDETLVKPNFTESNITQTCLNCHNSSNYKFHNSTLSCWDCHMNDTAGNIHPIQFIQYNGNFTGAKLTGATCYDCHKTNNVDNTTQRLANTKPPKIYSQSHSNDPINGTKWGDYWKYTPTVYQFASYEILGGNGSVDPTHPFDYIEVPSNDYMELNETQIGRNYDQTFPTLSYDSDFSSAPSGNWTSNTATGGAVGTVSASYDSATGNPAGSLKGSLTTSGTNAQHFGYIWWNYSFNYNPNSSGIKYTNASVNYSVTVASATYAQNIYLNLVKPSGAVVTLASSGAITANTGWLSLSNNSFASALNEDGSVTPYKLQLYAVLSGPRTSQVFTVNYDDVNLRIKEKTFNRYDMIINTTGVPVNGSSVLGMSYQVHKENTSLRIYNRTSGVYELLDTLDKGVFYDYTKNISSTHHILPIGDGTTGNVSVKFVDDDQSDTDTVSDRLHIRYLYVYTDRGLQYPCEQCHSPNKHYVNPTLGSPSKFQGNNVVNSSISASSTWCQQCHWQGAANYSKMIQEFNVTRNPPEWVPPEITGNATYAPVGGARDGTPYKDHTGFDMTDAGCFSCHGGSLNQNAGMTAFVHGVSEGVSGGPNCTNCHNVGQTPPKTGALVNISAMNDSNAIHKNLNSGATSPSGYPAENKKCWACHGSGSEPAAGNHPSRYNKPYNCTDCHVPGTGQNLNFTPSNTLLNVTQHYRNATNITTASVTSCYACHNRSEMMAGLNLDPDGVDPNIYNGANGGNNSTSHYGLKRTNLGGYTQGTNGYCTYCHNTTTNNATFYVSDFNNTIYNHSARGTTPLCSDCHKTGRIHNNTLEKPVSNDSYCSTCHGTTGNAATKDKLRHKALNCTECHANNSVGTLAGKDIHAIKYLTQSNTFATSNTSAVNCMTCHQTTTVDSSLTGFAPFKIKTPMRHSDNVSNGSVWDGYWTNITPQTACIYCHNNTLHNATPLGRILQWNQNYQMYGAISATNSSCGDCHYKGDSNYTQMNSSFTSAGLKTPPEITNGTNWKGNSSNYYNHSLDTYYDQDCKNCHGSLLSGSANMSEFLHNIAIGVAGGANCTACHNIGGTAGSGKLVNFSAINDTNAIHKNLNSGATNSSNAVAENKKCWACHGNGSEPSSHPSNYKTPYTCTSCHVQGAGQNMNFTPSNTILNVTQHYWNGTSVITANATSCYACHNKTEMMLGSFDPDGAGTGVYSGANGGNNSASHYGKKRSDMAVMANTTYCSYCHNNATSVFPFINATNNRTIANHSLTYPATNPECKECHSYGRLHNSTINRPAFALPNSSYCLTCHGSGGSATIKNLEQHNGTTGLNCTQCHLNTSKSIHPVRYLQQGGTTWDTSKTNAVNCTTCHQNPGLSGFNKAPITPKPLNHSTNTYSGALWNSTPGYWTNTSQQTSCDYCHGKTALHNSSGLGNITRVKGTNIVRQALDNSTWCANCHYSGASNYGGTLFSPEPPEITNATGKVPQKARDNTNFYNHSQDMATGYNDSKCKNCHNNALDAGATSLNFSHNVAAGGGGANCTSCHYIGGSVQNINITVINDANSIHKDLNKDATASDNGYNDSKKCWACHSSDGKEPSGHPTKYKTPYNCTDCHVAGSQNFNYTPNNTILNVTQHYWNGAGIKTPAATSCYACHNTTGMIIVAYDPDGASSNVYGGANGGNNSVSHYGKKRSDMAIQQNTTSYCDNCHNGSSSFPFIDNANKTISNHSQNYPATNPVCKDCHSGGRIHNSTLYKTSLDPLPNATYCTSCHGAGGTAAKNNLERHNNTGTSCSQCHLNTSRNIHPVNYLQQDNTWATTKASAVNCTSCHQGSGMSGFGTAPRVPVLNHSTNTYSGALWNSTPGYWTNTSQQSSCNYCHGTFALHNTSGLGNITKVKGTNTVRQGFTGGYWCANCHYSSAANYSGTQFAPQPPEVLNSSGLVPAVASDGTQFYNHSGDLSSSYDDAKCKTCHNNNLGGSATSLNFTHSLGTGGGGANCTSCHGLTGTLADGKKINQTAMNTSLSIHKYLNKDAQASDSNYSDSKKCWACHGDGTEPGGHPTRYKNPYNCVDCHVQGAGQNFNYQPNNTILNVTQHYWNGTSINTTAATSCYACHNRSEMMVGLALDPDGKGTVYGGLNGGNNSTSHYGKKRTDYPAEGTNSYCYQCHNNASAPAVFPYSNTTNATISNHSMNYAATNPVCADCHASGRIHNSTLYRPAFVLPNSSYCLTCHGSGGSATIKNLERHNGSTGLNCTNCHLNSTKSIHPVRYIKPDSNWSTTNSSAVNCTSCHQGSGMAGFGKAPLVQTPIWHSNDSDSGSKWNSTPGYWINTSQQSSCDYCHGKIALHNDSGLGNSTKIQNGNQKNQSLSGSYWCANCHYDGAIPSGKYKYLGNLFNPIPPEILNKTGLVPANASDGMPFQNHTDNVGVTYDDSRCSNCHLSDATTSAAFLHKLNESKPEAGGKDCLNCHASTANDPNGPPTNRRINATAFVNFSVHRNLNNNTLPTAAMSYNNASVACWACHGDGTQPARHPANYLNPKPCEYCHVAGNFNATPVYQHYPGSVFSGRLVYDSTNINRTCIACHNNSQVANLNLTYGSYDATKLKNATVSHYAVNRSFGESTPAAVTGILPNTRNTTGTNFGCIKCHDGGATGLDYGNARSIPPSHNNMGSTGISCQSSCHNSNPMVNITLHDSKIGLYLSAGGCYSLGCHMQSSTGTKRRR